MFLQVSGVGKQFLEKWVLRDMHFMQQPFQKLAIAGETGSGKSTLLKIMAGLEHPDEGIAYFQNKKIKSPLDVLIPGHPGIAYLSQHFELRANYYVEELLSYANQLPEQEANALFRLCRIDHLLRRKVDQLSGGEKQRIALARLLVGKPQLLLLDEPFSNLDPIHKDILKAVLHEISGWFKTTCILTSHDPLDTLSWADEILVMRGGQKLQQASAAEVYYHPADYYTAGLFGSYNLVSEDTAKRLQGAEAFVQPRRKLFIRPEQLSILPNTGGSWTIHETRFSGVFTAIELASDRSTLLVKSTRHIYTKGDKVSLGINTEYEPHYF